jgi:outer membrane receptor protein involved in Fe transport
VRFRGAYSRATRAPNLSELYQGASQNFPTGVNDPCDGITAASSGAIAAACKAIPAIANAINSPGGFKYGFLDYQSITGFNSGNPHLQPETAKTYTAGLVFTPSALRNFTATVDYYNIKIDNAVGAIDIPTLLNQCLLTGSPTYCTSVFRDPNSGKLTRIDQLSINTATLLTAGVDIGANYRMELPPYLGDSLGFALNWNWLQELNVINQQGAPTIHYKGQIAEAPGGVELPGGPANRATLQAQYNWRGLSVGWTIRYQGPMKDQVDLTQVSPQQLPFNSVPEFTYHDLQLGYSFVESKLKTKLYGGIRNLFDKKPPFLPTGMQTQITGTETAPSSYDAIGRQWFAGIEAEF